MGLIKKKKKPALPHPNTAFPSNGLQRWLCEEGSVLREVQKFSSQKSPRHSVRICHSVALRRRQTGMGQGRERDRQGQKQALAAVAITRRPTEGF